MIAWSPRGAVLVGLIIFALGCGSGKETPGPGAAGSNASGGSSPSGGGGTSPSGSGGTSSGGAGGTSSGGGAGTTSGGAGGAAGTTAPGGTGGRGGASGSGGRAASGGGAGRAGSGGAAGGAAGSSAGVTGAGEAGASGGAGAGSGAGGETDVCGTSAENGSVTLTCPTGQTISRVVFASFGTPTGTCGSFAKGSCDQSESVSIVQALCVGASTCTVAATNGTFTDPCHNTVKNLAIEVACAPGGGTGGGGAGQVPFKGVANSPCAARTALNVSWYYNWGQTETEPCSDGRGGAFVPMIWGHTGSEQSASGISSAVSSFVGKGYGYVLGFNEPDNSSQADIDVATAISLWPSFNNAAIQVGTPATSANSNGQSWFTTFMNDVNGSSTLHADFIALHWYGWNSGSCDANASQLESYIKWAEGFSGNRPIWLNEWGCLNDSAPDTATVIAFYKGALAVFARHPRVVRYAWYPWSTNLDLNNSDGSLTDLGMVYAAAPAYR